MPASANALRAGKAFVEFTLSDGKIRKGLASLEKRFNAVGQRLQSIGKIGLAAGAGILAPLAATVKMAADSQEGLAKFKAVFGDQADAANSFAETIAKTVGRSADDMRAAMGSYQAFFVGLGFGGEQARGMTQQLQSLSLDFAAFHNLTDDEAMTRFIAAMSGSSEVFDKFGINVKQAAMEQALLDRGIKKSWTSVTEQEKAVARLDIIMKSMTAQGAVGAAVRESASLANRTKALQSAIKDTAVAIGTTLLPYATAVVAVLAKAGEKVLEWVRANPMLVQAVAIAGVAIVGLGGLLFTTGVAFSMLSFAAAGLSTAIGIVGAVVGALLSPVGLVVAAIAGAGVAFATLTETGRGMVAQLSAWFGELGAIATTTFGAISTALASGDIGLAANILWAGLRLAWLQGTQALRETWHNMTAGIAKVWYTVWAGMQVLASTVWGNLSRGWSHTAEFFTTAWETAVGNIKKAWNSTVAFIQSTWLRIKGLFGSDVTAELDRIHAELAIANGEIDRQNANSAAQRNATASAAREQSRQMQAATLEAIGADLAAKLEGADDGAKAKIAAAEAALADARAALNKQAEAANEAAKNATETKAAEAAAGAAAGMNAAGGALSSKGTFSAAIAALTFGGGGVENEILAVNKAQLEEQRIANRKKTELPKAT